MKQQKIPKKGTKEWDEHVKKRKSNRVEWKKEALNDDPGDTARDIDTHPEFSGKGSRYLEIRGNGCHKRRKRIAN